MPLRVVIVGGYGNFGTYVARSLAGDPAMTVVIAGHDLARAEAFAVTLAGAEAGRYDISGPIEALEDLRPDLVINMVGPYNEQGYAVAEAAIACGAHYCDIADAREFIAAIGQLDEQARAAGVAALAGASSVPALTAAYLDAAAEIMTIRSVTYGISGAEQANRGAGTVAAVLAYVGQRFTALREGRMEAVTGWSDTHAVEYPELGRRWFGRGNVPDLALFPERYPTSARKSSGRGTRSLCFTSAPLFSANLQAPASFRDWIGLPGCSRACRNPSTAWVGAAADFTWSSKGRARTAPRQFAVISSSRGRDTDRTCRASRSS